MALAAWTYLGDTTVPGFSRFAFTYGPLLLAAQGPLNVTAGDGSGFVVLAGVNASEPASWATRRPAGSLTFDVNASLAGSGYTLVPYYEIQVRTAGAEGTRSDVPVLTRRNANYVCAVSGARRALRCVPTLPRFSRGLEQ
jgi:hypothetical protein